MNQQSPSELESNWLAFYKQFSKEDSAFIEKIVNDHVDLTSIQFKICVFLKAGYSTRNISESLHLSIRSVESHRYQLRKKMNVKPGENLFTFLMRYGS